MIKDIITKIDEIEYRSDECDVRKESQAIRAAVVDLKDTMVQNKLPELSAPQIGIPVRVIMLNIDGSYKALCNPLITKASGFSISREVDPCFPGKAFLVPRCTNVTVNYMNPLGKPESRTLLGYGAYLLQQGVDHLEGILLSDVGMEVDEDFDNASEDEKAEIIKLLLDSLNVKYTEIQKDIENDPEAKKLQDAIRFIQARESGQIQIEQVTEEIKQKEKKEDE